MPGGLAGCLCGSPPSRPDAALTRQSEKNINCITNCFKRVGFKRLMKGMSFNVYWGKTLNEKSFSKLSPEQARRRSVDSTRCTRDSATAAGAVVNAGGSGYLAQLIARKRPQRRGRFDALVKPSIHQIVPSNRQWCFHCKRERGNSWI